VSPRKVRLGELLALAGAACVIVSLFVPSYESPAGVLKAFDTFGPGVTLLLAATASALAMFFATLGERSTAVPVATIVWTSLLGFIAVIAAIVRVLERPHHATSVCAGPWLALAGALAILLGSWQATRDERRSLYSPATPPARPLS
jgi:Na+-transporting NADH:ubiquinone oxidoreductase subunit NqrE